MRGPHRRGPHTAQALTHTITEASITVSRGPNTAPPVTGNMYMRRVPVCSQPGGAIFNQWGLLRASQVVAIVYDWRARSSQPRSREKEIYQPRRRRADLARALLHHLTLTFTLLSPFSLELPLIASGTLPARAGGRQRETQAARWWKAEARDTCSAAAQGSGITRRGVLQRRGRE